MANVAPQCAVHTTLTLLKCSVVSQPGLNSEAGHNQFVSDYFTDDAVYAVKFKRRLRMKEELLLRTVDDIKNRFSYFQYRVNGRGKNVSPQFIIVPLQFVN